MVYDCLTEFYTIPLKFQIGIVFVTTLFYCAKLWYILERQILKLLSVMGCSISAPFCHLIVASSAFHKF